MPHYVKLKGVAKVHSGVRDAVERLLVKNGLSLYSGGYYRVSLAFKEGKRWKLKSRKVEVYNKFPCECCGPYWVAELVK